MGGGESGEELRKNASKWKDLAKEAMQEGGSSERNFQMFLEETYCLNLDSWTPRGYLNSCAKEVQPGNEPDVVVFMGQTGGCCFNCMRTFRMAMGFRCIAWVHKLLKGCFCMDDTERQDDLHITVSTPDTQRKEIVEQLEEEESAQAKIEFELEFGYLETEYWEKKGVRMSEWSKRFF
ncbi:hypothetical protein GIB67_034944 [Kingdonia uniflora]|uniref:Uncharacterized protein n=1 Tax=Kingdonia uniflora TaxID=39325 RepID=A0A7J7NH49_9MAGN|nr:hypothetical protein GIB67_034944 [Kingdonia uniflora]